MIVEEEQIQFAQQGDIVIITLTGRPHKANVFTIPLLQRLDELLDQAESNLPCALILTGSGKFFSAGFDLKALTGTSHNGSGNKSTSKSKSAPPTAKYAASKNQSQRQPRRKTPQGQDLVNYSWKVLARLLVFPAPTIAVFNGHAFGLGLFLGLACDHRVMLLDNNDDNNNNPPGKSGCCLCLPEITIGLPLGSGFAALAKCKLSPGALRTSALTGKQWTAHEALSAGIIDAIIPCNNYNSTVSTETTVSLPEEVLSMAQKLVSTSEKGNLMQIKMELYRNTYAVLAQDKPHRSKL